MEKFVLDTNYVSETRKQNPNKGCSEWLFRHPFEHLYVTTITIAEIVQGIELSDNDAARREIKTWLEEELLPRFRDRILPFDQTAAFIYGRIVAEARRKRKTRPLLDTMIAAIALAHGCSVVTRNHADFAGLNLTVINPWK
jgi:predicted nucleic acid-binding protein